MGGAMSYVQNKVMGSEEGEKYDFPTTLDGLGYFFNKEGQLRHKETGNPFEFNVKEGNSHYNQHHYNALGDVITEKVYEMMEKECKLQRSYLPVNAEKGQPQTFIFISGDLYTNMDKLMILVHGNGVVRAGQWARRLIINDSLESGTQLPYIKWARENGYSVIVANPNLNFVQHENKKKKPIPIQGNATPEEHMKSVWRDFVQRSPAKHVAIVAHSYGGVSTMELLKNHLREFENRVFAIALTDSVHGLKYQEVDPEVMKFRKQYVKNWASAYDPLDAPLTTNYDDVPTVSAGTDKHENTSYCAMNSIFKFFTDKYEEAVKPKPKDSVLVSSSQEDQSAAPDKDTSEAPQATLIDLSDTGDETVDLSKSTVDTESDQITERLNKDANLADEGGAVNKDDTKSEAKSEL